MRGIYFENHLGELVRFDADGLRVKASDLRSFAWEYAIQKRPNGNGGKVTRFSHGPQSKSLTIVSRGTTRQKCLDQLNELHAITEKDMADNKSGKLWLDGQYLNCFLGVESEIEEMTTSFHFARKRLTVLATEPFWCTEVNQRFLAGDSEAISGGKKYNLRYPYRFGTGYSNKTLYNDHYTVSPCVITIYGPAVNPSLQIGSHQYGVNVTLQDGQRLEINQKSQTIVKIDEDGTITNCFDNRVKTSDLFQPVPPGPVSVQYAGEWDFDITLVYRRSEPQWV